MQMTKIEIFNLNEDQDYDDVDDLKIGNLIEVSRLVVGSISMSSKLSRGFFYSH